MAASTDTQLDAILETAINAARLAGKRMRERVGTAEAAVDKVKVRRAPAGPDCSRLRGFRQPPKTS